MADNNKDIQGTDNASQQPESKTEPGFFEQAGAVYDMMVEGYAGSLESSFEKSDTYRSLEDAPVRTLVSDPFDYEKLQKSSLSMLNRVDQSMMPPKDGFHKCNNFEICTENAMMKCAMGSVISQLHILDPKRPVIGTTIKNRVATTWDCVPGINFDGFGACWNPLNPSVFAESLLASILAGAPVIVPMPCLASPMMPNMWMPLQKDTVIKGAMPVLVKPSVSICWGFGFITLEHCGQGLNFKKTLFRDAEGNIDMHLVAGLAVNVISSALSGGAGAAGKVAKVAAAAKATRAMALAAEGGSAANAARIAELTSQATKLMAFAEGAAKFGRATDFLANAISVADGGYYLAQGDYVSAALGIGGGGAGVVLNRVGARTAKKAAASSDDMFNSFKKTVNNDPKLQQELDLLRIKEGEDASAIAKMIKQHPEIYGDVSNIPEKDLEKLLKQANINTQNDYDRILGKTIDDTTAAQGSQQQISQLQDDILDLDIQIAQIQAQKTTVINEALSRAAQKATGYKNELRTLENAADEAATLHNTALGKLQAENAKLSQLKSELDALDPKSPAYSIKKQEYLTQLKNVEKAENAEQKAQQAFEQASGKVVDKRLKLAEEIGIPAEDCPGSTLTPDKIDDYIPNIAGNDEKYVSDLATLNQEEVILQHSRDTKASQLGAATPNHPPQTQTAEADKAALLNATTVNDAMTETNGKVGQAMHDSNVDNIVSDIGLGMSTQIGLNPIIGNESTMLTDDDRLNHVNQTINDKKEEEEEKKGKNKGSNYGLTPDQLAMLDNFDA